MQRFILILIALLISGCTTSTAIRTPVTDTITIEKARESKQTGLQIRWGGIIVKAQNKADHSIIEIVERPLTRFGVPKVTNKTGGRFLAKSMGFIEPENIKAGRYITISGKLDKYQAGQIGEFEYDYPVVNIVEYKVWPVNKYRPYYRHHSLYYHDPFWWHYPYYFRHHRYHPRYW